MCLIAHGRADRAGKTGVPRRAYGYGHRKVGAVVCAGVSPATGVDTQSCRAVGQHYRGYAEPFNGHSLAGRTGEQTRCGADGSRQRTFFQPVNAHHERELLIERHRTDYRVDVGLAKPYRTALRPRCRERRVEQDGGECGVYAISAEHNGRLHLSFIASMIGFSHWPLTVSRIINGSRKPHRWLLKPRLRAASVIYPI